MGFSYEERRRRWGLKRVYEGDERDLGRNGDFGAGSL